MKFGEAVIICKDINSEEYTLEEKINAIDIAMKSPTINVIFKDDLCEIIRFLLSICTEPADQMPTNEDWFVELTTEEKAKAIVDVFLDDSEWNEYIDRESAVEIWLKEVHHEM